MSDSVLDEFRERAEKAENEIKRLKQRIIMLESRLDAQDEVKEEEKSQTIDTISRDEKEDKFDESNKEVLPLNVNLKKELDRSKISTEEYYDIEAKRYAADNWVNVVADAFIQQLTNIRPLQDNDTLFDCGCGPGNTGALVLKRVKASKYFGIDLSTEFIKIAQSKITSDEFKSTEISIQRLDVLTEGFQALLDDTIKSIDMAWMSLVTEYLSKESIIKVCTQVISKLSYGGIFGMVDWGEHLNYPPIYGNGIAWNQGITKREWLEIAAEVVDHFENGNRIVEDEKLGKKKASRSECTVSVWCSTFEIQLNVNDTNSYLHYLVFRKDRVNEDVSQ